MFLFHGSGERGSRAVRKDGTSLELTPAELGRIVRNDPGLRKALDRSKRHPWTRPLMFAALDGETKAVEEFARSLVAGGYSRAVHYSPGTLKLSENGGFATVGKKLETQPALSSLAGDFISHAMANEALGVHGEFFPLTEQDAQNMFLAARINDAAGLRYYFRAVPDQAKDGASKRYEPVLAPWADSTIPMWLLDGHGSTEGFAFGMRTDRPLHFGDAVVRDGSDTARIVFTSKVFQSAGVDPTVRVVVGHCKSMATVSATTMTPAEELKFARHWLTEGAGQVFGATDSVNISAHNGLRTVAGSGEFVEALPEGKPAPPIPLAGLAANRIDPVEVAFPTAGTLVPKTAEAQVREVARKIARASAWRLRNTVGLPVVTITGVGKAGMGQERAEALGRPFQEELRAESTLLRSRGLPIRPQHVQVEVIGSEETIETGPTGRIEVMMPQHDLGEEAARPIAGYFTDAHVFDLNKAFAPLAPAYATKMAENTAIFLGNGPATETLPAVLLESGLRNSQPSLHLNTAAPAPKPHEPGPGFSKSE